jgi:hypothetical protein
MEQLEEILFQPDHTTHYPLNINMLDLTDRIAEMVSQPSTRTCFLYVTPRYDIHSCSHFVYDSLARVCACVWSVTVTSPLHTTRSILCAHACLHRLVIPSCTFTWLLNAKGLGLHSQIRTFCARSHARTLSLHTLNDRHIQHTRCEGSDQHRTNQLHTGSHIPLCEPLHHHLSLEGCNASPGPVSIAASVRGSNEGGSDADV